MPKILLVDDDELFHQSLREILEIDGHEVISAQNGQVASAMFRGDQFDLVITDLLMPKQNGLQTIVDLFQYSPNAQIIAISGGGGIPAHRDYLEESRQMGVSAVFQKPFEPLELLKTVRQILEG